MSSTTANDVFLKSDNNGLPIGSIVTSTNYNNTDAIRCKYRNQIVYCIEKYQITILVTELGIKSLQLPQYLQELGWCKKSGSLVVVEPHYDFSVSLAEKVLFDNVLRKKSDESIKHLSEESFLHEIFRDPLLTTYGVIILDEICQRTILSDTILALLKKILRKRSRVLKLLLVSNGIEAHHLQDFFQMDTKNADSNYMIIISIDDMNHKLQCIYYLEKPCADYIRKAIETILNIHNQQPLTGDIVVYLADQDEISDAMVHLRNYLSSNQMQSINFFKYCQTRFERHQVFFPRIEGKRNVIFTTNLFQKAVTQDCINYVIDCGFMRIDWFQAEIQRCQRFIVPVCKFTASQRARWWRSGKYSTTFAKVYRLYTSAHYFKLPERNVTEIRHSDLCSIVLYLKTLAVDNILRFNFLVASPAKNLLSAVETLYILEALDEHGHLKYPLGYFMADTPLPLMLSRMLFKASEFEFQCTEEILNIIAMLQVEPVFIVTTNNSAESHKRIAKRTFESAEGDLITLLNIYTAFITNDKSKEFCRKYYLNYRNMIRAVTLKEHLVHQLIKKYNIPLLTCNRNVKNILRCITTSYFLNVAYLHSSGIYRGLRCGTHLYVDRESSILSLPQPKYLIYIDIVTQSKSFMRNITVIQEHWLLELAPHYYKNKSI